jgi:putative flavoprotein involved in K+ transport
VGRGQIAVVDSDIDVVVIGGGQAGLAMGRALAAMQVSHLIYERHSRPGEAWRCRYDSLVLFSSRRCSALPGLRLPGDPDGFPTKDEVADYLDAYAERFALPVRTGEGVRSLALAGDRFRIITDAGVSFTARAAIIATGAFQRPAVPPLASLLSPTVRQLDITTYANPERLPARRVVVVGDGASGRQIALELARGSREVALATGRKRHFVPQRLFGRDSMLWFSRLGLLTADKDTWIGRQVRARDAIPGLHLRNAGLRRAGVAILPRVVGADGDELALADGSRRRADAVIWATGFRDEISWLEVGGAAKGGAFAQERGISPIPGLFYIGREWQTCRASALLCGVSRDARRIALAVRRHLDERRAGSAAGSPSTSGPRPRIISARDESSGAGPRLPSRHLPS